jgi:outer membrane protein
MRKLLLFVFQTIFIFLIPLHQISGQDSTDVWTIQACINYALQHNIQIRKAVLSNEINYVNIQKTKAERFPSVSASVSQNYNWNRSLANNEYDNFAGSNTSNYGISSNVKLYNGFKINNSIKQSELNYEAGRFEVETIKEDISLSIVEAYLQVLYAAEQVKNSEQQIQATTEQLRLSEERFLIGVISKADLQQVKSEQANEKLTLANASNLLAVNKLTLMQLIELHVSDTFEITSPGIENILNENRIPNANLIFQTALGIKPQIQNAGLRLESSKLDVKIARAGYQPSLSLNGGVNTGYSSGMTGLDYSTQVSNEINPFVGLTLSIPIYQNRQVKSNVAIAKIGVQSAELSYTDEQNNLRKTIEQVCVDVISAQKEFDANQEQFNAVGESFSLISEKYNQGLVNSVDYLFEKAKLIAAESSLLQSKFNLIFRYKILDFYSGIPITL